MILEREIKGAKMSSFSFDFQTLVKHLFPLYFLWELIMSLRRLIDQSYKVVSVSRVLMRRMAMR